jgi:hypothetical protein
VTDVPSGLSLTPPQEAKKNLVRDIDTGLITVVVTL